MASISEVNTFLKWLDESGYSWSLANIGKGKGTGLIKYVQVSYDTRFGNVFSIRFYGGMHTNTTITQVNGMRKLDCIELAYKWVKILHEKDETEAAEYLRKLEEVGIAELQKEMSNG